MPEFYRSRRPRSGGMWGNLALLLVAAVVAAAAVGGVLAVVAAHAPVGDPDAAGGGPGVEQPGAGVVGGGPVVATLDAAELDRAFSGNEPAAKARFVGKRVGVMGQVKRVRDEGGRWVVEVESVKNLELMFGTDARPVACSFPRAAAGVLALAADDDVTVCGRCAGRGDGGVTLDGCGLVAGPRGKPGEVEVRVYSAVLARDYIVDPVAATAAYGGKVVEFTDEVAISNTASHFGLRDITLNRYTVCTFNPSNMKNWPQPFGDERPFKIRGRCAGVRDRVVYVQECVSVK